MTLSSRKQGATCPERPTTISKVRRRTRRALALDVRLRSCKELERPALLTLLEMILPATCVSSALSRPLASGWWLWAEGQERCHGLSHTIPAACARGGVFLRAFIRERGERYKPPLVRTPPFWRCSRLLLCRHPCRRSSFRMASIAIARTIRHPQPDEDPDTEGGTFMEHHLMLVPQLRVNSNVRVFVQLDVMRCASGTTRRSSAVGPSIHALRLACPIGCSRARAIESLFMRRAWASSAVRGRGRHGQPLRHGAVANDATASTAIPSTASWCPLRPRSGADQHRLRPRAEGWINRADDTTFFTGGYLGEVQARWVRGRAALEWAEHRQREPWGATQLGRSPSREAFGGWPSTTDIET